MKRPNQKQQPKKYYPVPRRYAKGAGGFMLFWNAVYYLFAKRGIRQPDGIYVIETTHHELRELTHLSYKWFLKIYNSAFKEHAPYQLTEGAAYDGLYTLRLDYEQALKKRKDYKPFAWVEHGWPQYIYKHGPGHTVPLAILNLFFVFPRGKRRVTLGEIQRRYTSRPHKASKTNPYRETPLSIAKVQESLRFYQTLNLLRTLDNNTYELIEATLFKPPRPRAEQTNATLPAIVQNAMQHNPAQATLALHLARMGEYDLNHDFQKIFVAARYVGDDLPLLEAEIKKRKKKDATRWKRTWEAFKRKRKLNHTAISIWTQKFVYIFESARQHQVVFEPQIPDDRLVQWCKLVVWLADPDHLLETSDSIRVSVSIRDQPINTLYITAEDAGDSPKRLDLPKFSAENRQYYVEVEASEFLPDDILCTLRLEVQSLQPK